jgi:hypothetical protein
VKAGLIQSLERPGGNVTGMWLTSDEAAAARVETLKKMMPSMIKLVVLASATYPENQLLLPWPRALQSDWALRCKHRRLRNRKSSREPSRRRNPLERKPS